MLSTAQLPVKPMVPEREPHQWPAWVQVQGLLSWMEFEARGEPEVRARKVRIKSGVDLNMVFCGGSCVCVSYWDARS